MKHSDDSATTRRVMPERAAWTIPRTLHDSFMSLGLYTNKRYLFGLLAWPTFGPLFNGDIKALPFLATAQEASQGQVRALHTA